MIGVFATVRKVSVAPCRSERRHFLVIARIRMFAGGLSLAHRNAVRGICSLFVVACRQLVSGLEN